MTDEPVKRPRLPPRVRGLLAIALRRARNRRRAERQRMLDYYEDLQEEGGEAEALDASVELNDEQRLH